jgi:hypothetical protein
VRELRQWLRSGPARKKICFRLLILLVLIFHINSLRLLRDAGAVPLGDFIEYWSAARVFLQGGNPYSATDLLSVQHSIGLKESVPLRMWNPPWLLPLLLPLSASSYWISRAVWYVISLTSIFGIALWFWIHLGGSRSWLWISSVATLSFFPVLSALFLGQISPLVLIGLWGFIWALGRKRPLIAGAFLLLIGAKPHLLYLLWLILALWIIKSRNWKILSGSAIAFAGSSLVAVAIDPLIFTQYLQAITSSSGPVIWRTPTWGLALLWLFPGIPWLRFVPSLLAIPIALLLWRKWQADFCWDRHFPTIILLSVTSNSFTWTFDWLVLLPIVLFILIQFDRNPRHEWCLLACLALIFLLTSATAIITHNYFYTLWLPPALWLLYWAAFRRRESANINKTPAEPASDELGKNPAE